MHFVPSDENLQLVKFSVSSFKSYLKSHNNNFLRIHHRDDNNNFLSICNAQYLYIFYHFLNNNPLSILYIRHFLIGHNFPSGNIYNLLPQTRNFLILSIFLHKFDNIYNHYLLCWICIFCLFYLNKILHYKCHISLYLYLLIYSLFHLSKNHLLNNSKKK